MKGLVWVGFDVGKKKFSAALDTPDASGGQLKLPSIPQKDFDRTENGVEEFFIWASEKTNCEICIVMETTGYYSMDLACWLIEKRPLLRVCIVHAGALSSYIKSLYLGNKTDALDAKAIARFGSERKPSATKLPSEKQRILQELTRERNALVKMKVEAKNRSESLKTPFVKKIHAQTLASLTMQIKKISKEIRAFVLQNDEILREVQLLSTIPGVSFVSAYTFYAEFGSLKQYARGELSSRSGLAPRIKQSGTSVNSSSMSRRGPGRIRQILYINSLHGIEKIPLLNTMYHRLISRGKKRMQARCACMRKMLLIMRAMVIHNVPFDKNFPYFLSKGT